MKERKDAKTDRRSFLKLAGIGTVAGAAAVATGGKEAEAAAPAEGKHAGYRETEHVRTFYETARF